MGCSPWGHRELDTTECLTLSLSQFVLANLLFAIRNNHVLSVILDFYLCL